MTVKEVLIYPHNSLRMPCEEVDVNSEEFAVLCQDLKDTLNAYNAHGLAAPQIGKNLDVLVVKCGDEVKVFANPRVECEGDLIQWKEGCLSFPTVEELISRYEEVTLAALDENGEEVKLALDGLEAVAVQHEFDHLNGILFIDRVSKFKKRYMLKKLEKWKKRAKRQGR